MMRGGLMVGVSACLAMLLAVLMPAGNAGYIGGTTAAVAVILAVGFAAGSVLKRKTVSFAVPVRIVFALTVIAVAVDAFTGCNLCKFALPSSYQLAGYRFYGVGNEYAGAVIVMAAMVALFSSERARVWVTPALGIAADRHLWRGQTGRKLRRNGRGGCDIRTDRSGCLAQQLWRQARSRGLWLSGRRWLSAWRWSSGGSRECQARTRDGSRIWSASLATGIWLRSCSEKCC